MCGLPPLARGTRVTAHTTPAARGLTPARAGNTSMAGPASTSPPAYPRSRGEHSATAVPVSSCRGLPPLARGTHPIPTAWAMSARLTPARAGNTAMASQGKSNAQAYPRSRGEHRLLSRAVRAGAGLPPLARGTLDLAGVIDPGRGLTPARAGNTELGLMAGPSWGAYPRSRGEHARSPGYMDSTNGLPPLARGTHDEIAGGSSADRLTPARAGNTRPLPCRCRRARAYPRSRGEHGLRGSPVTIGRGLPPLARGTPDGSPGHRRKGGLTPARAGNTVRTDVPGHLEPAYPRSRGEHHGNPNTSSRGTGLPPLARGTLQYRGCTDFADRLTPARAGNT